MTSDAPGRENVSGRETLGDWLSSEPVRETIARAVYHHAGLPRAWMLLGEGQGAWLSIADHVVVDLLDREEHLRRAAARAVTADAPVVQHPGTDEEEGT